MASKDVEMKEVQKDKGKKEAKKEDAKEVQPPAPPTAEELRAIVLTGKGLLHYFARAKN